MTLLVLFAIIAVTAMLYYLWGIIPWPQKDIAWVLRVVTLVFAALAIARRMGWV